MKEQRELQTLIDSLESHIREQAEQIDSLQKSNQSLLNTCVKYSDEIVRLRRAVTMELGRKAVEILGGADMKEQREMQTHIDELNAHIKAQSEEIDRLRMDAVRYRWLCKYTGQMFMATEQQVSDEVDRAMAGVAK